MSKLYIFEKYTPWDNCLPEGLVSFEMPKFQAEQVLKKRCLEEIAKILMDIDDFVGRMEKASNGHQSILAGINDADQYDQHRASIVSLMREMKDNEAPSHISETPNLTWAECLAVIATGKVVYACLHIDAMTASDDFSEQECLFEIANYYLGPATEAGTIAMMLSDVNPMYSMASSNLSKFKTKRKSQRGGLAKAELQAPLKSKALNLFDKKYADHSARNAATLIVRDELLPADYIASDGRRIIAADNEITRIQRWILEHQKKRNNLPQ
jgi:hypothetical protein